MGKGTGIESMWKILFNKMYFIGPTGTPVFLDKCKIDDIFLRGEAEITPT